MFQFQEVVNAVRDLTSTEVNVDKSHCQLLEIRAKQLGYQSYHHLRESLKHLPTDQFGKISLKLMRQICADRIPSRDVPYFEFQVLPKKKIGFYSHWIGWDKHGDEVRIPRPLEGSSTAAGLRDLSKTPIYVVESPKEVLAWRHIWGATALIPSELAEEFFAFTFNKRFLVEKDPPMDLVRAKAGQYMNNFADAEN